jgi:hypothetical protein
LQEQLQALDSSEDRLSALREMRTNSEFTKFLDSLLDVLHSDTVCRAGPSTNSANSIVKTADA